MNCHAQIWNQSPYLDLVRKAYFSGQPIEWKKVHQLPDFVYFNHSIHVAKGVGCVTCHGRVDQMAEIRQGPNAADGLVPRLPSQSVAEPAPAANTSRR